jgi:DNA polymerase-3 subunit epsilon
MREIVLDTETTGLEPAEGHRLVEIGCVEIVNRFASGRTFHAYLDPERDMPDEAFRVHKLSAAFLAGKPRFAEIAEEFLAFIGDAPLVIHNAAFDTKFLNAELARLGRPPLAPERIVDSLHMARRRHPGARNDLDSLCDRYGIDRRHRTAHGALIDAGILADVYAELTGGRQADLGLSHANVSAARPDGVPAPPRALRRLAVSAEDDAAHRAFIAGMKERPIWLDYLDGGKA